MEITIETGIPVPIRRIRTPKWPLRQMKVGDSFFVPSHSDAERKRLQQNVASSWRHIVTAVNWRFTSAAVEGGFRVWRVE